MDDRALEAMLESELSDLPPTEQVVRGVTPWRRAFNRILWGMGLTTITLNFLGLDLLLPAIGNVLTFLGYRALRQENPSFRACYWISAVQVVHMLFMRILDATVWAAVFDATPAAQVIGVVIFGGKIAQYLLLGQGIRALQRKSGLEPHAGAAAAMAGYQLLLIAMALLGLEGILVLASLVLYCFMLRSLYRLSGELDAAGYAAEPAPTRFSDRTVAAVLAAAALAGIVLGCAFCQTYPMDWQPASEVRSAEAETVRQELLALGFPEDVLNDLTEGELLELQGAEAVLVEQSRHPMNDGRRVTRRTGANSTVTETVYDVEELTLTGIAVKLPGERETWRIIHHFRWTTEPGWYGTECMRFHHNPYSGWTRSAEFSGRVLCDVDGAACAADYQFLDLAVYSGSGLFDSGSGTDLYAAFSLNPRGVNNRGYVLYDILETDGGWIIDEWIWYSRSELVTYPFRTALENSQSGSDFFYSGFRTVWDAVQFKNSEMEEATED